MLRMSTPNKMVLVNKSHLLQWRKKLWMKILKDIQLKDLELPDYTRTITDAWVEHWNDPPPKTSSSLSGPTTSMRMGKLVSEMWNPPAGMTATEYVESLMSLSPDVKTKKPAPIVSFHLPEDFVARFMGWHLIQRFRSGQVRNRSVWLDRVLSSFVKYDSKIPEKFSSETKICVENFSPAQQLRLRAGAVDRDLTLREAFMRGVYWEAHGSLEST